MEFPNCLVPKASKSMVVHTHDARKDQEGEARDSFAAASLRAPLDPQ